MERLNVPRVAHRFVEVDGVRIFYREAGPPDAPTMLLLHGFPSASHQYRRLIDALGGRYRLIAPDYPGFGHSDAPESATRGGTFAYTFDRLADVVEGFCEILGLDRFVMYVFDWGAPVGFRLATRRPEWMAGLVVQNGNAYEEGLSQGARDFIALRPDVNGDEEKVRELLTLSTTRGQYVGGATDPELRLFDTGHFALEENLPEIAPLIATFLDRTWRSPVTNRPRPRRRTEAGAS